MLTASESGEESLRALRQLLALQKEIFSSLGLHFRYVYYCMNLMCISFSLKEFVLLCQILFTVMIFPVHLYKIIIMLCYLPKTGCPPLTNND